VEVRQGGGDLFDQGDGRLAVCTWQRPTEHVRRDRNEQEHDEHVQLRQLVAAYEASREEREHDGTAAYRERFCIER
jgi:hypothetical protein